MRFSSIISRIVFLHVVAVGVASIIMPVALYWLLSTETKKIHQDSMQQQAASIASHLAARADGTIALNLPGSLNDLYSKAYGRYAYAILDDHGQVLFSSLDNMAPVFASDSRSAGIAYLDAGKDKSTISGVSVPQQIDSRTVWVQVAENLAHRDVLIDDVVAEFFRRVGWITIPILLLLLVIDIAIFRRALRPLVQASEQAGEIGPTRIHVRLADEDMPKEIRPLVLAVNQALDRLERGFRVQREFTADAAHELRTPLTILRTRLEGMGDKTKTTVLMQDIDGMSRVVNQLLEIAELETLVIDPSERADLCNVCAEVAEFIAPLALAEGKEIELKAANEPVWIKGNAEMLRRAVRNLAENAIKHTAQGSTVEIVVLINGTVQVLDRGAGIPLAERELIFRRFWRQDRRRAGNAGLGLSIVRGIVEAHAASITVETRPTGGAQFSMYFVPTERASNC